MSQRIVLLRAKEGHLFAHCKFQDKRSELRTRSQLSKTINQGWKLHDKYKQILTLK
jgi:hypothetical protein